MPRQNHCLRACFETFKLGYKPISMWSGNHISAFKNIYFCLNSMNVSQIDRCDQKIFQNVLFLNTFNEANISGLKSTGRNNVLHIYGFINHDPPCFLKW